MIIYTYQPKCMAQQFDLIIREHAVTEYRMAMWMAIATGTVELNELHAKGNILSRTQNHAKRQKCCHLTWLSGVVIWCLAHT